MELKEVSQFPKALPSFHSSTVSFFSSLYTLTANCMINLTQEPFFHTQEPFDKMSRRRNRNREAVDPRLDCVIPGRSICSILSRLPAKSLVRFKRVSRPWMDLIKNPAFINLHYNRFSLLPKTISPKSQRLSCTFLDLLRSTKLDPGESDKLFLSSCKGLICIGRPLVNKRILLWNPATRFWKVLPPPIGRDKCWSGSGMLSLGFTCNEDGDDFKVVRINCTQKNYRMRAYVEMYSSKSDSWAWVKVDFPFFVHYDSHQAEVNGVLYWGVFNQAMEMMMLRFDTTNMSLELMPMPMPSEVGEDPIAFVNWEGQVAGLHCESNWVDVWLYLEEQKAWRRKAHYVIPVNKEWVVACCLAYNPRMKKIVGMYTNGGLFDVDVNKEGTGYGRGTCLGTLKEDRSNRRICMYPYEESLAHVRGMREMNLALDELGFEESDRELVVDGFISCLHYTDRKDVDVYFGLA